MGWEVKLESWAWATLWRALCQTKEPGPSGPLILNKGSHFHCLHSLQNDSCLANVILNSWALLRSIFFTQPFSVSNERYLRSTINRCVIPHFYQHQCGNALSEDGTESRKSSWGHQCAVGWLRDKTKAKAKAVGKERKGRILKRQVHSLDLMWRWWWRQRVDWACPLPPAVLFNQ